MIFDDTDGKGERCDSDILVADVDSSIAGEVAEDVVGLIEVGDCVGLVADEVVEAVGRVCVDEAVADPLACSYAVHT